MNIQYCLLGDELYISSKRLFVWDKVPLIGWVDLIEGLDRGKQQVWELFACSSKFYLPLIDVYTAIRYFCMIL